MLEYCGVKRSTFYANIKPTFDKYREIKLQILDIYRKSGKKKGYRWITSDLRKCGFIINHKTVLRLMQQLGIKSIVRAKKYNSYINETSGIGVENILKRDFSTTGINQKWTTDVTEFKVCGKKIYLSAVMDMHSKEIIAHSVSFSPNLKLVMSMIKIAFKKIKNPSGVIIHSDHGWHYRHISYKNFLRKKGAVQSMSRKGNCLDNSIMENFFGLLKQEIYYGVVYYSYEELKSEIERFIKYYNEERIKEKLGWMSPVQYRLSLLAA